MKTNTTNSHKHKRERIEVWASQGQGSIRIWKGSSFRRAIVALFKAIGSGSIGLKINDRWVK